MLQNDFGSDKGDMLTGWHLEKWILQGHFLNRRSASKSVFLMISIRQADILQEEVLLTITMRWRLF